MDDYLRSLLAQTPLDADAERRLARLARAGDPEARSALIVAGMRSVVQRALMLGLRGEDLRDGVQAGAVGLIRAVDRFDPDHGARLATFAWAWIGAALAARASEEVELVGDRSDPRGPEEAWTLLDGLAPSLAEVVRLRYGVVPGESPMSRRAVARQLALSESKVRTIEAEAMRHLRTHLARIGDRASRSREADPL